MSYEIRAFIGVWPDETVRKKIAASLRAGKQCKGINWTPQENFHLTLKFLGQVPLDSLPGLFRVLEETTASLPPLTLTMNGPEAFPNTSSPRVLCYDFKKDQELRDLTVMALKLDSALETIGFPRERKPFRAHATAARIKDSQKPGVMEAVDGFMEAGVRTSGLIWPVDEICLIRSELNPSRSTYEVMASYQLLGDNDTHEDGDDL